MYAVVKYGDFYDAHYKEFACDTHSDLNAINTSRLTRGSKAVVLDEDGKTVNYIYAGNGTWVVSTEASAGGGSSATFDMTDEEVLSTLAAANCLRVRTVNGKVLTTGDKILLW